MKAKITFEEKIKQIESIIAEFKSGNVTLEKTINNYKVGIKLIDECRDELKQFETDIKKLKNTDSI